MTNDRYNLYWKSQSFRLVLVITERRIQDSLFKKFKSLQWELLKNLQNEWTLKITLITPLS